MDINLHIPHPFGHEDKSNAIGIRRAGLLRCCSVVTEIRSRRKVEDCYEQDANARAHVD